jgi:hypothetical protein
MSANSGQDTQLVLNKARPVCRELTTPPSTTYLHAASFDAPVSLGRGDIDCKVTITIGGGQQR